MSHQQPYEDELAKKLNRLPAPGDAHDHWPKMKALLDRELPEGGASGGARRWILGIVAGILITGAWLLGSQFSDEHNSSSPVARDAQQEGLSPGAASAGISSTGERETTKQSIPPTEAIHENTATLNNNTGDAQPEVAEEAGAPGTGLAVDKIKSADRYKENRPNAHTDPQQSAALQENKNFRTTTAVVKDNNRGQHSAEQRSVRSGPERTKPAQQKSTTGSAILEYKELAATAVGGLTYESAGNAITPAYRLGTYLVADYAQSVKTSTITRKAKSRFPVATDRTRAIKNRVVGTGDQKNFVVGLSLPLSMPLSDQRVIGYNFSGGSSTLPDYLPAPLVQYHISQKSFVQAELQFISPQFIQPALLYQSQYTISGGGNYNHITNSVYARKLYYFNLPLAIHYSPFKNFYLGSGLQFSSLLGGIASFEKSGYSSLGPNATDSVISIRYSNFRKDSLSGKFNSNEMRVMLDANYYWERFSFGLRYNQAVNNYINQRLPSNGPVYTDKNKSLQFYLRYNLWENKKRTALPSLANR